MERGWRLTERVTLFSVIVGGWLVLWPECYGFAKVPPPPCKPEPKASEDYIRRLALELDSPDYRKRVRACRELVRQGKKAVAVLEQTAEQGSLEATLRAESVLEAIYLNGDVEEGDAAEAALERLQHSRNPIAAEHAQGILIANSRVRERRALERIVALGGVVKDMLGGVIDIRDPTALGREIPILQLGLSWRGGDEGLKYVKKLQSLQVLYVIDGCGVSEKALEFCDGTFRFPMWGFVESFNVSVAAAISLYISARRRRELLGREGDLSSREEEALMAHYLKLSA